MSNFVHGTEDPVVEIFNPDSVDDNDIQLIDRDNENSYNQDVVGDGFSTPGLSQKQLYNSFSGGVSGIPGNVQQYRDDDSNGFSQDVNGASEGATANNQLAQMNPSKYFSSLQPLPPLQPLSESIIPNGIGIQPLALQHGTGGSHNEVERKSSVQKKKKESSGPKTRPAFVMKIWSMVNDPANKEYIRWNDDGKTFQVFHREDFMKLILPKYFKHNNFASFVRQLNMYGWHKVQDINSGSMNQSKDDRNLDEVWQFENPYFVKDREDLLDKIVRNKSVSQDGEGGDNQLNINIIINELDQIKMNQMAIGEDLRRVRKDNKTLWQENYIARERHKHQAQTLDKILKFLAAVYGNNAGKILEVDGALDPPDLDAANQMTTYNYPQIPRQQTVSPNPYSQVQPSAIQKPRLMLMQQAHKRASSATSSDRGNSPGNRQVDGLVDPYENINDTELNANSPNSNVNRIYQQIINQDASMNSPRHFFPELTSGGFNSPSLAPSTPSLRDNGSTDPSSYEPDIMTGLEQSIAKQGQSIEQVQDWIKKIASQQQSQQNQIEEQQDSINVINDGLKPNYDDFVVNDFLSGSATDSVPNFDAPSKSHNSKKRTIEEIHDENSDMPSDKRRVFN